MLRRILQVPFWAGQVFTQAKSFKANSVIGSPGLNRLGLHVLRLTSAHLAAKIKWLLLTPYAPKKYRKAFQAQGFIVIENFLADDDFHRLEEDFANCRGEVRECIQGDTLTHRILLDETTMAEMTGCRALLDNKFYQRLLTYCSGRLLRPHFYAQCIKNHFATGHGDPQKTLHADTFHPTIKSWFFVSDVDENNGPFTYVPTSNQLTRQRLKWEYARSKIARHINDGYSEKGSFRLNDDDLEKLGLPRPVGFKVKKNTLVIANTFGFHCRGQALEKSNRYALYATSRGNPFNIFPGINSKYLSRLSHKLAHAYWHHLDKKAARVNQRSSWHIVPSDDFHAEP